MPIYINEILISAIPFTFLTSHPQLQLPHLHLSHWRPLPCRRRRHAAGYVSLLSAFPTKLKLRFFKSDPQQLAEVDPLLRQVLPLTKKVGPVHSLDTAKAQRSLGMGGEMVGMKCGK